VRPGRIELPTDPWQGPIIPLNHGRDRYYLGIFYAYQQLVKRQKGAQNTQNQRNRKRQFLLHAPFNFLKSAFFVYFFKKIFT
jgi:hypothetical protein